MLRFLCALGLTLVLLACDSDPLAPTIEGTTFAPSLGIDLSAMTRTPNGVYVQDLQVGSGQPAAGGTRLYLRYTGWLADGTRFDTNEPSGPLLDVVLGVSNLVPGFTEGLRGMRPGGRRRMIIPPALGYGTRPPPSIPTNAILVFEAEWVPAP